MVSQICLSALDKDDLGDCIGWEKSCFPHLILKVSEYYFLSKQTWKVVRYSPSKCTVRGSKPTTYKDLLSLSPLAREKLIFFFF